jgi:hypothetical protein
MRGSAACPSSTQCSGAVRRVPGRRPCVPPHRRRDAALDGARGVVGTSYGGLVAYHLARELMTKQLGGSGLGKVALCCARRTRARRRRRPRAGGQGRRGGGDGADGALRAPPAQVHCNTICMIAQVHCNHDHRFVWWFKLLFAIQYA